MILKATYGPRIALQCVHVSDHFILKATLSSEFCHLLDKKNQKKQNMPRRIKQHVQFFHDD